MNKLDDLQLKIFADGADLAGIKTMYEKPWIKGFTTNPTLMRKAGVSDYKAFAHDVLALVRDLPVSFEVFTDDFDGMVDQAMEIASWGSNVNVKIPVMNTKRDFTGPVIRKLSENGVQLNITAVFTLEQVRDIVENLSPDTPAIVSVFAGRVADTGTDPIPLMCTALDILKQRPRAELLWASPRELLNIVQADECGCHIITVTHDILSKLSLLGKNHADFSLETVEMFHRDASNAGYSIAVNSRDAATV